MTKDMDLRCSSNVHSLAEFSVRRKQAYFKSKAKHLQILPQTATLIYYHTKVDTGKFA